MGTGCCGGTYWLGDRGGLVRTGQQGRVAGPSRQAVVISELSVEEGDHVEPGHVIAVLADLPPCQRPVVSPISGQVLEVNPRPGERVGLDGIIELGKTDEKYAIAGVYETDISRVRLGQRATIKSPALTTEVQGTVERIGLKIREKDVLGTNPTAKADVRVVEVEVRLDEVERVANLTNLQVDVTISP